MAPPELMTPLMRDVSQKFFDVLLDHEGRTAAAERAGPVATLVERGSISNLSLIFQPNEQTLEGSFSSVSTPNFARKYSLESS